jgi:hypothetical protein
MQFRACSKWNRHRYAKGASIWEANQYHREVWFIAKLYVNVDCVLKIAMEEKRVSLNLVYPHWANLGSNREVGDARAHNDLLDDRARYHWIDPRGRRYPHVFAPDKRTISSRRPDFFHTWRDPGSLHLLQAEHSFSHA